MVYSYFIQQMFILWTIYIAVVFWKLHFPIHYLSYILQGHMRFIHMKSLLLVYIYPLISTFGPVLSFIVDVQQPFYTAQKVNYFSGGMGYQTVQFPPLFCVPINYLVAYYLQIMPIVITFPINGTLLVFILRRMWLVS